MKLEQLASLLLSGAIDWTEVLTTDYINSEKTQQNDNKFTWQRWLAVCL